MSELSTKRISKILKQKYGVTCLFTWTPEDLKIFCQVPQALDGSFYYLAIGLPSGEFGVIACKDCVKRTELMLDFLHAEPETQVEMLQSAYPESHLFIVIPPNV